MFGALISATDPVATLAILGSPHVNADETLYALVFGESILNDAVAIVLFNTFRGYLGEGNHASVGQAFGTFCWISIISTLLGLVISLVCAVGLKSFNFYGNDHYEFIIVIFFAYTSYCVAQTLELSGIMSLFFCGIGMAHYAYYDMSSKAANTTGISLKGLAMVCETFLFIYLGITVAVFLRSDLNLHWSVPMIIFSVLLCAIGRFVQIMGLGWCLNRRGKRKIPIRMLIVMVFAGLRGAIAFALSINVMTENSKFIVSTTMTIVIATTLGNGLLTLPFLTKMGMVRGPNAQSAPDSDDDEVERESWKPTWKEFDRNWMQYYFGGKHNPRPARSTCHTHQVAPEPEGKHEVTMGFKEGQYCYAPWADGEYYLARIGAELDQEEKSDDPTYEVEFEEKGEGGVVYRSQMRLDKPMITTL